MTEPSDLELVRRFAAKDPAERDRAFAALFERHHRRAFDLAWRVLGDASLAADAVQESFLTVFRKGARFEARAQFSSWLYRVVLNQCIDVRRRERRHRLLSLGWPLARDGPAAPRGKGDEAPFEPPPAPGPTPDAAAAENERAEAVRKAIARLSPKLAAVVLLRYPEGRSYEEIGEILRLQPGTVKSRLNRAHAALREMLGSWLEED